MRLDSRPRLVDRARRRPGRMRGRRFDRVGDSRHGRGLRGAQSSAPSAVLAGQTQTEWGRIWQSLPHGFPILGRFDPGRGGGDPGIGGARRRRHRTAGHQHVPPDRTGEGRLHGGRLDRPARRRQRRARHDRHARRLCAPGDVDPDRRPDDGHDPVRSQPAPSIDAGALPATRVVRSRNAQHLSGVYAAATGFLVSGAKHLGEAHSCNRLIRGTWGHWRSSSVSSSSSSSSP